MPPDPIKTAAAAPLSGAAATAFFMRLHNKFRFWCSAKRAAPTLRKLCKSCSGVNAFTGFTFVFIINISADCASVFHNNHRKILFPQKGKRYAVSLAKK